MEYMQEIADAIAEDGYDSSFETADERAEYEILLYDELARREEENESLDEISKYEVGQAMMTMEVLNRHSQIAALVAYMYNKYDLELDDIESEKEFSPHLYQA